MTRYHPGTNTVPEGTTSSGGRCRQDAAVEWNFQGIKDVVTSDDSLSDKDLHQAEDFAMRLFDAA